MSDADGLGGKVDRLRLAVESMNARADARHEGVCSQLQLIHAAVDGIQTAQVEQGKELAAMRATCIGRLETCGEILKGLRHRVSRQSDEIVKLGGKTQEISQVTAIADITKKHRVAAAKGMWQVLWRVLVALAALGLFGTGTVEVLKALK